MHQIFEQEKHAMANAKAFAKLTRKARRMAKSKSKKRSVKPAKVQTMTVLPPPTNIFPATNHSLQNFRNCPAVISKQTCAVSGNKSSVVDAANFCSSALMCSADQSGMQQNIFRSRIPAMPFPLPSAFAPWTPNPIPYSFLSLPPPLGPCTSWSTAFLLGATWAAAATKPLSLFASVPSHA